MKSLTGLPPRDGIHLWVVTGILSPELDNALGVLSPEELERARRFRFEEDRWRYLGGTLFQRLVLAQYLSCPLSEVSYSRNQWGKPSLNQSHDSMVRFSLSRSHQTALLAVNNGCEVGADLEYALGRNCNDLGMKRYFARQERDFIESASDIREAFFEIWARKEAYIKGIGRGLSHPLGEFDVTPEEAMGKGEVNDWSADAPEETWQVQSIALPEEGYGAAIATPFPSSSIELIPVDCDELLATLC